MFKACYQTHAHGPCRPSKQTHMLQSSPLPCSRQGSCCIHTATHLLLDLSHLVCQLLHLLCGLLCCCVELALLLLQVLQLGLVSSKATLMAATERVYVSVRTDTEHGTISRAPARDCVCIQKGRRGGGPRGGGGGKT